MERKRGFLLLTGLLLSLLAGLTVTVVARPPADSPPAPATPVWLGNPIAGEEYSARHIWDLQIWRGRVYLGYGDWAANLGPVDIWYYSPTADLFFSETVYVSPTRPAARVDEEAIHRYVVIDGDLYIPGTDPSDPVNQWDWGNFYRNEGQGWVKFRTIPNGVHNYDMTGYQGSLFAGVHASAPLLRSANGGLTWTSVITGEFGYTHFLELYEQDKKLFAIQSPSSAYSKPVVYRYEEPWFVSTTIDLVPDQPDAWVYIRDGVYNVGDRIVYLPWWWRSSVGCTEPMTSVYQAFPEQNGQRVSFFDGKHPRNMVVGQDGVYVLDAGARRCTWATQPPDPQGYTATIYVSLDLADWLPVATAHFSDTPHALEVQGDRAYVGTYNGDIYALDLALPNLHLTKTAHADTIAVGERLTYTLVVANDGEASTLYLALTDTLPAGTIFASATRPYTFQGQTIAWTRPPLGVGERLSVTLAVTVGQVASGTLIVNDDYGARCARIATVATGDPVLTRVVQPPYYFYLPLILRT